MTATLERLKNGYTTGGRRLGLRVMSRLADAPVTPNQITVVGFSMNVVAGVLIYERMWILATVVFILASILDILDGALARARGRFSPFGSFLDSTTDRLSEGVILGAVALVLADDGETLALACAVAALTCSFLISYTRAKAESVGVKGEAGLMARAERIVLLAVTFAFAGLGALPYGIELLAVLTAFTVLQRTVYVYRQLSREG
jgi:CDP-diacylglycerol--glycerol-3-phosphate 3-phosphatidyltransferase